MDIEQIQKIVLLVTTFSNLVLALLLWLKGKSKASFYLGLTAFFAGFYAFTWAGVYFFETNRLLWLKLTWMGIFIPPLFLTFVYYFTGRTKNLLIKILPWYLIAFFLIYMALTTSYIVSGNPESLISEYPYFNSKNAGSFNFLGRIYIILGAMTIAFYLIKEYRKVSEFKKLQIKYFLWGLTIYIVGGGLTAGVLPLFYKEHYGYVIPLSAVFSFFLVAFSAYAILKKELFGIKIILTEFLIFLLSLILFSQILLAQGWGEKIFQSGLFFLFSFLGYLLIKTTYSEIKKKEESEKLSKELSELNIGLEEKVKERTKKLQGKIDELEKFHRLTVGRELKMVELKKEIENLEELKKD